MPPTDSLLLDLPGFKIIRFSGKEEITFSVELTEPQSCPGCGGQRLRRKDAFMRRIRHVQIGLRTSWLELKAHKHHCRGCGKYFNTRIPGVRLRKRASEPCRLETTKLHHNGWTQRSLSRQLGLGSATVERWYQDHFAMKNRELISADCPRVMGIDEHYFTKKDGFATTIADLVGRKVFDVALGRSESSLRSYLRGLAGKDKVRVVVMDLSETYRSIAKKYFPNALIVADRFHVVRLVNHQFVKAWGELDPAGRKHRGLVSLMRRRPDRYKPGQYVRLMAYVDSVPGLRPIWTVWQDLLRLLRMRGLNQDGCRKIIPEFLWIVEELRKCPMASLKTLGETLDSWKAEIGRMFRFSKTNGITEGLHNKMEMLSRRAFGFRNFENYRLRVRIVCG